MEKLVSALMSDLAKLEFEPILEKFERKEKEIELVKEYFKSEEFLELKKSNNNNPDFLLGVHLLEERLKILDDLKKLVEDIIKIDWEKDEALNEYNDLKHRFLDMNDRINLIAIVDRTNPILSQ